MSKIDFKIVENLIEAKFYWDLFVEQKSVFDNWDFRYCFYKYFNYPIYFKVGFINDIAVGLLPLQKNTDAGYLEFFGGNFMENNRVSIKFEARQYVSNFYENLPGPAKLEYVIGEDDFTKNLKVLDQKYFLKLDTLKSSEDYLQNYFDSESRGKLKRKLKKIQQEKVEVVSNNLLNIEELMQFKIGRFGESSTFNWPYRKEIFRDILKLPLKIFLNSFYLNDALQGVSLSILYQEDYAFVNFGISEEAFKNFTTFLTIYNIDQAIVNGAKSFDAFCGDCGWKELWHLDKSPQYTFYQ